MAKLILTRGIPGSGKSTWAREWVSEDPKHRVRYNNDDIRNMLGEYWVPSRENLVSALRDTFLYKAMFFGYDIVIDNMNLNPKEVEFYIKAIDTHNNPTGIVANMVREPYFLEFKDFPTPLSECIDRDSKREHPIGKDTITQIYNKYKNFYKC